MKAVIKKQVCGDSNKIKICCKQRTKKQRTKKQKEGIENA